ncbi:MAG: energy-coupling factor transporter transmembrane protein EcfT [Ktedonobacterales bacterium]|nr:energy-coupling factor transporter transmembrane protein EcfT [Ktedonobacterales bacterium]
MLNNLPVGTYVAGRSPLHWLRARTKLLILAWLATLFFIAAHKQFHFGAYLMAYLLLGLALASAHVPPGYIWRRMKMLAIVLAIGAPFSLAWIPGDSVWRTFGPVVVTYDGLWFTFAFAAVFVLLYLGSVALTLTTTPVALAEGIVLLLRPVRRVGLPADEFGLMTLISLRFFPILIQETEQLIKAQMSRGADLTTGSLTARIRGMSTLLVPLVQAALRRAEGLTAALEARGYSVTGEATLLHEGRLRLLDWLTLVVVVATTGLAYWKL